MSDELSKHGLFFDYLYNLRVLDPNVSNETADLKEKSGEYCESMLFSNSLCVQMIGLKYFICRIT